MTEPTLPRSSRPSGTGLHRARAALLAGSPIAALLLALVLSASIAWPIVGAGRASLGPDRVTWIEAAEDGYTRLPLAGEAAVPATGPKAVATPGLRQYTLPFDRSEAPEGDLALYAPHTGGGARLFAGRVSLGRPETTPTPSMIMLSQGVLAEVPRMFLGPGANQADVVLDAGHARAWPQGYFLGPVETLKSAFGRQARLQQLAPRLVLIAGGAGLVFALLLLIALPGRAQTLGMAAVIGLLTLLASIPLQAGWGAPPSLLAFEGDIIPLAVALLVAVLASRRGRRPLWPVLAGAAALLALTAAVALHPWDPQPNGGGAATVLVRALTLAAVGLAALGAYAQRRRLRAVHAAAPTVAWLVLASLFAAEACRTALPGTLATVFLEAFFAVALLVALSLAAFGLSHRLVSLIERRLAERRTLSSMIRARDATIRSQRQTIERELSRRVALEERERITRDIHDGFGGQLLALLVRVRRGRITRAEIATGLQNGLNDLRMIMLALDQSSDTLAISMAIARSRLQAQVEGAGVEFAWDEDRGVLDRPMAARQTLNVLRILQESVSNALTHAKAGRVGVRIGADPARRRLLLTVEDDGGGLKPGAGRPGGRGLDSMRHRAALLHANLELGPRPDGAGTRVSLSVPFETDAP